MYQTTYYTEANFNGTTARIKHMTYYRGRYWTTFVMPTIYSPAGQPQWHRIARSVYVGSTPLCDAYRKYYKSRELPTEGIAVVPKATAIYHMGEHYYLPTV